jgi:murein DD-endopeptidase MepM/ murein hydrolase activator NlpD
MFDGASDPLYYTIQEEDNLLEDVMEKTGLSRATIKRLNPEMAETKLIPNKTKLLISEPDIYLGVKVVRTVEYDETIEAPMTRIKNSSMYVNATKVKKAGKDGSRHIVKEITEIDGKTESKIISSVVTKEAVAGELYVGTKPYPTSYSSLAGTGAFSRPINGGFTSCPYGGYPGHRGIDLTMGGAYGKPIHASAAGTVISSGWAGGYGYCVKIRHSNGYVTLYAHCSSLLVSAGQSVTQGQQIARIGSTGNSTGPHVHFEVRYQNSPMDPLLYLPGENNAPAREEVTEQEEEIIQPVVPETPVIPETPAAPETPSLPQEEAPAEPVTPEAQDPAQLPEEVALPPEETPIA